ncbi:MAG: hypothetical protein R3B40_21495 [Polyangiales bacterium]
MSGWFGMGSWEMGVVGAWMGHDGDVTQRPDVDVVALEEMVRRARAVVACPRCPGERRRTTRRLAGGELEVCCAACGGVLVAREGSSTKESSGEG